MNDNISISVIITVYNIEQYIVECIESVLEQDYKNIEVILVDDGSEDHSGKICDTYATNYTNIRVIHKNNGGQSEAKNVGVAVAKGEYITFLDGDDFWNDKSAISKLVKRLTETQADVLNYSYIKFYEDTLEKEPYFNNVQSMPINQNNRKEYLTSHGLYIASPCNKLVKRDLIQNRILFETGVCSEDICWCAEILKNSQKIDFICENFYCYRQRRNSITHTVTKKKCEDLCNNIIKCIEFSCAQDTELKKCILKYTAYQYGTFFAVQAQSEEVPVESIKCLEKYKTVLKYHGNNKKLIILNLGCKILGVSKLCWLIRKIRR